MGVCGSQDPPDPNDQGKKHDRGLQKELDEEKNSFGKRHKLLLLGPGNSGKSTFFKQLCTIHGNGLPEAMMRLARHNVYDCCISQAKSLISLWHDNIKKQGLHHPEHMNIRRNIPSSIMESPNENDMNNNNMSYNGTNILHSDNSGITPKLTDDNIPLSLNSNSDILNGNASNGGRLRGLSKTGKKAQYSNVPDEEDDDEHNSNKTKNITNNIVVNNSNNNNNGMIMTHASSIDSDITDYSTNNNNNNNIMNSNNSTNNSGIIMGGGGDRITKKNTETSTTLPHNERATSVNSSGITDDYFDFSIEDVDVRDSIEFIENDLVIVSNARFEVNVEIAGHIKGIWSHKAMKRTFLDRNNLTVVDSAAYFFDNIDRIAHTEYEPTELDVLLVRNASTGIREQHFWIENNLFYLYDVGGQRSERKKWIQCFDSVDAVLFVASLSCYDQNLFEENDKNAMHETIRLFDEVVNSRYFRQTSMIIFFNKADLFRKRIKRKPLGICFPDYAGEEGNFESGIEYIRLVFIACNKDPRRDLYCHVTTATDKTNVTRVFNDVQHSVVLHALRRNGIL